MVTRLEMLGVLDGALAEAEAKLQAFGDVEEKSENARAQLAATLSDLETTKRKLAETQAQLAEVERSLKNKEHLLQNEKARSLADINRQIADAQELLKQVEGNVQSSKREYNDIVNSMQSLSQRLKV